MAETFSRLDITITKTLLEARKKRDESTGIAFEDKTNGKKYEIMRQSLKDVVSGLFDLIEHKEWDSCGSGFFGLWQKTPEGIKELRCLFIDKYKFKKEEKGSRSAMFSTCYNQGIEKDLLKFFEKKCNPSGLWECLKNPWKWLKSLFRRDETQRVYKAYSEVFKELIPKKNEFQRQAGDTFKQLQTKLENETEKWRKDIEENRKFRTELRNERGESDRRGKPDDVSGERPVSQPGRFEPWPSGNYAKVKRVITLNDPSDDHCVIERGKGQEEKPTPLSPENAEEFLSDLDKLDPQIKAIRAACP